MAVYNVEGQVIADTLSFVYGYEREYTDVTSLLTFERKEITTSGVSDSTTRLLVELPNTYNVEVRFSASSGKFAIFRKSSNGTITMLRDYDWWTYTYSGDSNYTYYACIKFITNGTIQLKDGGVIIRVLQYRDIGVKHMSLVPDAFKGKTLAVIGDSIVQGRFCKNGNTVNESMLKPWSNMIAELIDCEPANFGVGGGLVYNNDEKSLYANCGDVTGYGVVIVCGGTNDYGNNTSASNFQTAFAYVLDTLIANNTKVIIATPVTRTNRTGANSQGLTLADYCNYEKQIAQAKNLQVIDLFTLTNTDEFKSHLSDGLHPDEIGHRIIADLILENV